MKNENKLTKFAILVLFITMVALILISGTYAKYTTTVSGSDTATIAKWSILVNGNEVAVTGSNNTVAVNLFDTILDTNGGATETDVAKGMIAPGTQGKFAVKVQNKSDVTANCTVAFSLSDSTLPLEFKVGDGEWAESLTNPNAIELAANSAEQTIEVEWRWAFDGDDTAIGIAARDGKTLTVTASITAEQVD